MQAGIPVSALPLALCRRVGRTFGTGTTPFLHAHHTTTECYGRSPDGHLEGTGRPTTGWAESY